MNPWLATEVVRGETDVVVRLVGAIDIATLPDLRRALDPEVRPGATVVVDLAGVSFLSSDGAVAFNEAQQALRRVGGRLVLWRPHPIAEQVLNLFDSLDVRRGAFPSTA